jgi:nitroreductase
MEDEGPKATEPQNCIDCGHYVAICPHAALNHSRSPMEKQIALKGTNTIFAFAYLALFATALGLGSCWAGILEMCIFAQHEPILNLFQIEKGKAITGAVMAGFPQYHYRRLVERNPLAVTWIE